MVHLDGIRAFAVGGVILEHWASGLPRALRELVQALDLGGLGVECFFVLSGFLITLILLELKEQHLSFRTALGHFYMRRVLRIFPAYYFALLVTSLLFPEMRAALDWHALYLSNIYPAWHDTWPAIGAHFWTLSVEEQFYLFWPLIVLVSSMATIKRIAVAFVLLAPLSRLVIWQVADGPHIAIWTITTSALDLLCFGAFLACIRHQTGLAAGGSAVRRLVLLGLVALFLYTVLYFFFRGTLASVALARTLTALFFGALVASAANGMRGPAGWLLASRPIVWLGMISYGLYIWHPFVPKAYLLAVSTLGLQGHAFGVHYIRYPLMTVLLLLVTSGSYYLLERPIRNFRKHYS
jgi:peptidoglycan/LPS O-acetylase OafA/YrhL